MRKITRLCCARYFDISRPAESGVSKSAPSFERVRGNALQIPDGAIDDIAGEITTAGSLVRDGQKKRMDLMRQNECVILGWPDIG